MPADPPRPARDEVVELTERLGELTVFLSERASAWSARDNTRMKARYYDAASTVREALSRLAQAERERDQERAAREEAERRAEALAGALSWIEPLFVDERTSREKLLKRVQFAVADGNRALTSAAQSPSAGEVG